MRALLVGPYEPGSSRFRFLSPPLGVWRLCGFLVKHGHGCDVFDPNLDDPMSSSSFRSAVVDGYDVIGFSTTHETLENDLSLAVLAKHLAKGATIVLGGIEATLNREIEEICPEVDVIVEGQGERALLEMAKVNKRLLERRISLPLMPWDFADSAFAFPFASVPYGRYWKAAEENGLPPLEARSVRLYTTSVCKHGCSFCSYTNMPIGFQSLNAEGIFALVSRAKKLLEPETIIFSDDSFTWSRYRVLEFCERVAHLENAPSFICEARADQVDPKLLDAMKRAGFRLIGYGIESWSDDVLKAFRKGVAAQRQREAVLATLESGITPFLNIILFPPMAKMRDVKETAIETQNWIELGCEASIEPFVLALPGASITREGYEAWVRDAAVRYPDGTERHFPKEEFLLPSDPKLRELALSFNYRYREKLKATEGFVPSRERSKLALKLLNELAGW